MVRVRIFASSGLRETHCQLGWGRTEHYIEWFRNDGESKTTDSGMTEAEVSEEAIRTGLNLGQHSKQFSATSSRLLKVRKNQISLSVENLRVRIFRMERLA